MGLDGGIGRCCVEYDGRAENRGWGELMLAWCIIDMDGDFVLGLTPGDAYLLGANGKHFLIEFHQF